MNTLKNADGAKYSNPADTLNGTKSEVEKCFGEAEIDAEKWNKEACEECEEFSEFLRGGLPALSPAAVRVIKGWTESAMQHDSGAEYHYKALLEMQEYLLGVLLFEAPHTPPKKEMLERFLCALLVIKEEIKEFIPEEKEGVK
jgi:hypothetical protein